MKRKFPIICPAGSKVVITQGFMPITNPSHQAVDFVIWNYDLSDRENRRLTYASQLVAPVNSTCVKINDYGFMNELGNGCDIEWQENGYYWRLHFWHNASNVAKEGQAVTEGQIIAYMGNTGYCVPMPSPFKPYDGTHCHMSFSRYKKNAWGGNIEIVYLDPTEYFDINSPYQGADSSVVLDLEPIKWAWLKLGIVDNFGRLLYLVANIFK